MRVPDGVATLATDEQIEALTAAGTVHRHADLAEGRAEEDWIGDFELEVLDPADRVRGPLRVLRWG